MITYLELNGFKTFQNFKIELSPFTVIAGTNGSGKSNLFDGLRLLSRIAETDLKTAFNEQRGDASELFTLYSDGTSTNLMSFVVEMLVDRQIKDSWGGEVDLKYTRLRYELDIERRKDSRQLERLYVQREKLTTIKVEDDKWVKKYISDFQEHWRPKVKTGKRGIPYISTEIDINSKRIQLHQDGKGGLKQSPAGIIEQTILSSVNSVEFPHALAAKQEMRNWHFLQLNPEELRKPSPRLAKDVISEDGSNLAAALFRIKLDDKYALKGISRELTNLLPSFVAVEVDEDLTRDQYVIKLKTEDKRVFSSKVLSEGTLRLLALCTLKYDNKYNGVLNFEEPENGVHPFRLEFVVKLLKELTTDFTQEDATNAPLRQVITNTHSPKVIGEIFKSNISARILFASMINVIIPEKGEKLRVTKMLPVVYHRQGSQIDLFNGVDLTTQEKNITLNEVNSYLQSVDFEQIITKKSEF
jgi:predicted ATPase